MGEGTRREREGAGRAPERDTRAGAEKVFSPPPPGLAAREGAGGKLGPRLARGIDDSAGGHGHLGGGSGGGRRSADVMDGLRGACGRGASSVRGRFGGEA